MRALGILSTLPGRTAILALGLAALSGCSGLRETLGLDRNPPDEFQVVSRAPLEVPAQFELPPPNPGAPRPQEMTPTRAAASTLFGGAAGQAAGDTEGERTLLAQAGADAAVPNIRAIVNRESVEVAEARESFLDSLLFWQDPEPPGTVVDPRGEARRLRENSALGRPVTEGETPIIVRKRRAPLEGLTDFLSF
ncbi:DUF3035 domain-containing protein [Arenibaculum sp.]|jgi:hypothetical protein|uniref:DUF3035 domain-containing protein n=1 Tax=Arenibaculum sp. TaxID=2865862 RepID=UPI002E1424E9|nr:DUF3035 domain-containing protein [Arenibaculum sp.]